MSVEKEAPRRLRMTRKWRAKVLASGLPDVLSVECGEMHARLHLAKIGSGTRGPCIEWEGNWLTPVQFEDISGLGSVHNWKRSICYENRCLNCYIKLGLVKLHPRYCDCDKCITPLLEMDESRGSKRAKYEKNGDSLFSNHVDGRDSRYDALDGNDSLLAYCKRRERRETALRVVVAENEVEPMTRVGAPSCTLTDDTRNAGIEYLQAAFDCDYATCPGEGEQSWKARFLGLEGNPQVQVEGYSKGDCSDWHHSSHSLESVCVSEHRKFLQGTSSDIERACSQSRSQFDCDSARDKVHMKRGKRSLKQRSLKSKPGKSGAAASHARMDRDLDFERSGELLAVPLFVRTDTDNKMRKRKTLSKLKPAATTNGSRTDAGVREGTVHERLAKVLRKAALSSKDVLSWSVDQVVLFVDAAGFSFESSLFRRQLINGEALMRLRERHLVEQLKMKLGPSLRLFALVRGLQQIAASCVSE